MTEANPRFLGHGTSLPILVADDDRTVRSVLTRILEADGYQVLQTDCGSACLQLAESREVGAFLLDLQMPDLSGVEICRHLRASEQHRFAPVICITAADDDDNLSAAFDAGVDDFIAKPVNPIALRARLNGLLQKTVYLKELHRIRNSLNRYVSVKTQKMVEAFAEDGRLPAPSEEQVCILFSDIRGFTQLSQVIEPAELFEALSEHLGMQVDSVYAHGGYIDKFAGDGIMAIFEGGDQVTNAATCALDILSSTEAAAVRGERDYLKIGIGIHTGAVLVGNIGSSNQLDYSAIGEAVNLAARLCGLAEPMSAVVSRDVVDAVANVPRFRFTAPYQAGVRGFNEPVVVYELVAAAE
ncbi:MAG: adenylate/guanylate cyclase domain-containing protein [Pseudomonadota bacterium]